MFATKTILAGTYIAKYDGESIVEDEANDRMEKGDGNYIYFFSARDSVNAKAKDYILDARKVNCICKFVNDSARMYANCLMRIIIVQEGEPELGLFSSKQIPAGTELRYPYGDDPNCLWWRKEEKYKKPLILKDNYIWSQHSAVPVSQVNYIWSQHSAVSVSQVGAKSSRISTASSNPAIARFTDGATTLDEALMTAGSSNPAETVTIFGVTPAETVTTACDSIPAEDVKIAGDSTPAEAVLKGGDSSPDEDGTNVCDSSPAETCNNVSDSPLAEAGMKVSVTLADTMRTAGDTIPMAEAVTNVCDLSPSEAGTGASTPAETVTIVGDIAPDGTVPTVGDLILAEACTKVCDSTQANVMTTAQTTSAALAGLQLSTGGENIDFVLHPVQDMVIDSSNDEDAVDSGVGECSILSSVNNSQDYQSIENDDCKSSDSNDNDSEYEPNIDFTDTEDEEDEISQYVKKYMDGIEKLVTVNEDPDEDEDPDACTMKEHLETEKEDEETAAKQTETESEDEETAAKRNLEIKLEKMDKRQKHGHKSHNCTYCGTVLVKLPRHMEKAHKDRALVKEALSYPPNTKKRTNIWTRLRREGDFAINIEAMSKNLTPHPVRKTKTLKEVLPCEFCKGFFETRKLSDHANSCFLRTGKDKTNVSISRKLVAVNLFDDKFSCVEEKIVSKIREPDLKVLIRNDQLLLTLGGIELEKKDHFRFSDIMYTLRKLAQVILKFRELTGNQDARGIDLVQPDNYDDLVKTMKEMSGYVGSRKIANPHLVLKIGYSIRSLIVVARVIYLKQSCMENVTKLKCMMKLYQDDYTNYIAQAKAVYENKKGNMPEELPTEEDLKKLRQYCISKMETLCSVQSLDAARYALLSKLAYVRVLTFNARRGGEPSKLTKDDWKKVLDDTWKRKSDLEKLDDPIEIQLAKRLKLCYVEGKRKVKGEIYMFLGKTSGPSVNFYKTPSQSEIHRTVMY